MSPVSRGRKGKRPAGTRQLHAATDPRAGLVSALLREFKTMRSPAQALEAEAVASAVFGSMWPAAMDTLGTDPTLDLVDAVEKRRSPEALAVLRAFAAVAPQGAEREAAAAAAQKLEAVGVSEPAWGPRVGGTPVSECWQMADVYGDASSLLLICAAGGRSHGVVVLVDHNHMGGWAKDIFVVEDTAGTLRAMRADAASSEGIVEVAAIDPARARAVLEAAVAATDQTYDPEVAETYAQNRALLLARLRSMPPATAQPTAAEPDQAERDRILAQFMRSAQASALPPRGDVDYCARLLVDFGADYDEGRILRVGPGKLESFLLGYVPAKVLLDADDREALPGVVAAWASWAGTLNGLPSAALAELAEAVEGFGGVFGAHYSDSAAASPARVLLEGLDVDGGIDQLGDAVDRRMFTMPFLGTRVGDEDFPRLNPNDPDERQILITGEHPEFHASLGDPSPSDVGGVNPTLHIALHEVVATQLWADDPPEAWQAGRRLLAAGHERHEALHAIMAALAGEMHAALQPAPASLTYVQRLNELGRDSDSGSD